MRGEPYFALLDELADAIATVCPRALVQREDFANRNAFAVPDRYRRRLLSFNDDIQGTGAVVVADWRRASDGTFQLAGVVHQFKPHVLVGVSGQAGAFTESTIEDMWSSCPRPIVLALSNPTSNVEATPGEVIRWTNGAAVVGTGSPFAPVEHDGRKHVIGQGNNVLIFPGVGLGATAVEATWLPDEAFTAAAAPAMNDAAVERGVEGVWTPHDLPYRPA